MYVMHRKGKFRPATTTDNQCRQPGHTQFEYRLTLVTSENLDDNGFIVDHLDVHRAIELAYMAGSCEEMHHQLYNTIISLFLGLECKLLMYKAAIIPLPEGEAYMEFVRVLQPVKGVVFEL